MPRQIPPLVAALFAVTLAAGAPAVAQVDGSVTVSLSPSDADVSVGETTTYDVVIEGATDGIGALNLTVGLSNPTVANVTGAAHAKETPFKRTAAEGTRARYLIVLPDNNTYRASHEIVVGNLTVEGTSPGTATLNSTIYTVLDADGDEYEVATTEGATISVSTATGTTTAPSTSTPTQTPTSTQPATDMTTGTATATEPGQTTEGPAESPTQSPAGTADSGPSPDPATRTGAGGTATDRTTGAGGSGFTVTIATLVMLGAVAVWSRRVDA